jgi:hypothetical protein
MDLPYYRKKTRTSFWLFEKTLREIYKINPITNPHENPSLLMKGNWFSGIIDQEK